MPYTVHFKFTAPEAGFSQSIKFDTLEDVREWIIEHINAGKQIQYMGMSNKEFPYPIILEGDPIQEIMDNWIDEDFEKADCNICHLTFPTFEEFRDHKIAVHDLTKTNKIVPVPRLLSRCVECKGQWDPKNETHYCLEAPNKFETCKECHFCYVQGRPAHSTICPFYVETDVS